MLTQCNFDKIVIVKLTYVFVLRLVKGSNCCLIG